MHRFEEYAETAADFAYTESPYSASKIAREAFIYSYARCYGLRYLVFRFSNVYGRFDNDLQRMVRVLPLFIHQLSRDEPITVYGGDEKVLDFTYVDDCVDGIARGIEALAAGRVANETINLAYGQGNTLVHAAELIARELGVDAADRDRAAAPRRGHALRRRHPQGARVARLGAAGAAGRGHPEARSPGSASGARPSGGGGAARRGSDRTASDIAHGFKEPAGAGAERVLALFGPTASGKTAVAGILRERLGAEVISADSARALRRPAGPHGGAGLPGPARRRRAARRTRCRSASTSGSRTRRSTRCRGRATPLVVGGTGLYFRAALSSLELPPPPAPGGARAGRRSTTGSAPSAHAALAERDAAAAARVHANDRKRVVRALELAEPGTRSRPSDDRLWTEDTRLPTTHRRARRAARGARPPDRGADARDGRRRASRTRREPRWARPLSATARKVMGLEQFATLPEDEAVAAVAQATRRLARYQRKWMRRMPGVVTLDGNRPAGGGRR